MNRLKKLVDDLNMEYKCSYCGDEPVSLKLVFDYDEDESEIILYCEDCDRL